MVEYGAELTLTSLFFLMTYFGTLEHWNISKDSKFTYSDCCRYMYARVSVGLGRPLDHEFECFCRMKVASRKHWTPRLGNSLLNVNITNHQTRVHVVLS